jgi:hypothetical protein
MRRPDLPWPVVASIEANPRQVVIIGLFSLFSVIYFRFSSRMFLIASIRSIDDSNQHSHNGKRAPQKKWVLAPAAAVVPPPPKRELTFNPASCL